MAEVKHGGCLLKIRGIFEGLKSAERRIAAWILENPQNTVTSTINSLAESSSTSYASVNRFCRKLGYTGFKEMKDALQLDLCSDRETTSGVVVTPDMNAREVCGQVYESAVQVLGDLMTILDVTQVEKCTQLFLGAKRIFFIGTGNSGLSAKYAYSRFFRIGLPCVCEEDATLRDLLMALTGAGDVVFAVSSSGRSQEIVNCAREAEKNGARIVALTDFAISPISKIAEVNLYTTPRNGSEFMTLDMPCTLSQFTVIDMIYVNCCKVLEQTAEDCYERTHGMADMGKIK